MHATAEFSREALAVNMLSDELPPIGLADVNTLHAVLSIYRNLP